MSSFPERLRPYGGCTRQARWSCVVATSAPDNEPVTLRKALDADDAIDGQTSADDVDRSKPDGSSYRRPLQGRCDHQLHPVVATRQTDLGA